MTSKRVQAAAIQMASGPNVSANLLKAEQLVSEAAKAGAKLVVLPENFAFMGKKQSDICALAEPDGNGPLQSYLSQLARRCGVWLVGGTIPLEAIDSTKVRAVCLVFDSQGKRVARYDKIHLFDVHLVETNEHYVESANVEPGAEVVVVDSPLGRLGIAVCYDIRFPELFRRMLDNEMEVICLPAAFTANTGKAHWEILVRARAIENLCYVIAAAQGGFHVSGRETHGHSMIVDPWGTIIDQLPRNTGHAIGTLDMDFLSRTRRHFPTVQHRRLRCS